jgi:WD40 repeat protein
MSPQAARLLALGILLMFGATGSGMPAVAITGQSAEPQAAGSFARVAAILKKNCQGCHNSTAKMGGLIMDSYASLMKGGAHGAVIIPGNARQSHIILRLEGKLQPRMPMGGDPLPEADIKAIEDWIHGGAKGPAAGEATLAPSPPNIPDIKPVVPVTSPITSLAYSPDSKILAVGGYQKVELRATDTGKVVATLAGHADYVRSLAFSPDGKWLAAAGGLSQRQGEIKIWEVASHRLLHTMTGHSDCIFSVAISPEGKLLASGSYDKSIILWDTATGKNLKTLRDHIDAVFSVVFSPDGKWLASGSQDRTVKIWNVTDGERLYTLGNPADSVTSIAFRPRSHQLAAAGYDRTIWVWNLAPDAGTLAQSLIADEDAILQIAYTPDGKRLITTSSDLSVTIRDADSLNPLATLDKQPDWVETIGISPDGKWLAAGCYNGTLSIYNLQDYEEVGRPVVAFQTQPPAAELKQTATR